MNRQLIKSAADFSAPGMIFIKMKANPNKFAFSGGQGYDWVFLILGLYWFQRLGGEHMKVYLDLAVILNMVVDFLLLMGTARLLGSTVKLWRTVLASVLGGIYAGVCLLPGWSFLGNLFWRAVSFAVMVGFAFGWEKSTMQKGAVFMILNLTLGGAAIALERGGFFGVILMAGLMVLLFTVGLSWLFQGRKFLKVELQKNGKKACLTALYDTGNTLKDPVSGKSVLVVGPSLANYFLGLTDMQLRSPLLTMESGQSPGIRLIPYRAVGTSRDFLLASAFDEVRVNGKAVSYLVAFAPEAIGTKQSYDALIGGNLSCI